MRDCSFKKAVFRYKEMLPSRVAFILIEIALLATCCSSSLSGHLKQQENEISSVSILIDDTPTSSDVVYISTLTNATFEAHINNSAKESYHWEITLYDGKTISANTQQVFVLLKRAGSYFLSVTVSNSISKASASVHVRAEDTISGLAIRSSKTHIAVNETIAFTAHVVSGSSFVLNWTFTHESGRSDNYYPVKTRSVEYRFTDVGMYVIELEAKNNVSRENIENTIEAMIVVSNLHIIHNEQAVDNSQLMLVKDTPIKLTAEIMGSNPVFLWILRNGSSQFEGSRSCDPSSAIGSKKTLSLRFSTIGLRQVMMCSTNLVNPGPILVAHVALLIYIPIENEILSVSPSTTVVKNSSVDFVMKVTGGSSVISYNWTISEASGSNVAAVTTKSNVLSFRFEREGKYVVAVVPFDDLLDGKKQEAAVYVQSLLCPPPVLTVVTLPLVQERIRSKSFRLEVSAIPSCTMFRIRYSWIVYRKETNDVCPVKASKSSGVSTNEINTDNRILTVPKNYLQLGVYCFRFEASVGSASSSETFVVSVTESKLVAVIKGGHLRLIGVQQQLTVDGSDSYDPDNRIETEQFKQENNLLYVWYCNSTVTSNHGCQIVEDSSLFERGYGCFMDDSVDTSVVTTEGNTLQLGRTYLFLLKVTTGTRISTAWQQVP